jgi:hypothetical protein
MAYRKPLKELRADTEAAIKQRHNPPQHAVPSAMREYRENAEARLDRMKELRDERLKQASVAAQGPSDSWACQDP